MSNSLNINLEAQTNLQDKSKKLSKEQKLVLVSMLTDIIDDSQLAETPDVIEFYESACLESDSDILTIAKWLINSI